MFISDTDLHTVQTNVIDIVTSAKFHTLTIPSEQLEESATAKIADASGNCVTFPPGFRIEKNVTAIKLLSGSVLCY